MSKRVEQVVSSRSPQTNSSFYRMIAAHGEGVLVDSFMIKRPSVGQRMAMGKGLRKQVPRAAQAIYNKAADRPDPVEILERQSATRVQKLVPIRYGRMLANPFAFLRGSAAIMASDLSSLPVSGTRVAACGDAHVKNFGVYASAERNLVFSINDFDEVYVGPWEWDLKRLAASAVVATKSMGGTRRNPHRPLVSAHGLTESASIDTPKWDIWRSGTTALMSVRCLTVWRQGNAGSPTSS